MLGAQLPRICSYPEYVSSAGTEAIELAALAGLSLDPWQQFVLTHSLGERPDGKWAAPTVGLVVGRQNGKNAVLEARELVGLFLLGEQLIIHSAHEQATSSEHFRRLLARIESVPEFARRILKAPQGKGAEAIELRGGQRVLFKTRTGGGGRGLTADLVAYDEAMIMSAAAKSALGPTMAARSMDGNTQTWYAGSAVDQLNPKHDGVELARIRRLGIAGGERLAYFEFSAPGDDPENVPEDVAADPEMVALANPGLGIRISSEWVEHERKVELGAREYAVERLGIGDWPADDDDTVINLARWAELTDERSEPVGRVFVFDVDPARQWASIAVVGKRADGRFHLEVADRRKGTGWLLPRIAELVAKHRPTGVFCDGVGPAASLVRELDAVGVKVVQLTTGQVTQACGLLFDMVERGTVRHRGDPELASAIRGAAKRPLGDAWAWSRKNSSVDITPLVACTLGLWAAAEYKPVYRAAGW